MYCRRCTRCNVFEKIVYIYSSGLSGSTECVPQLELELCCAGVRVTDRVPKVGGPMPEAVPSIAWDKHACCSRVSGTPGFIQFLPSGIYPRRSLVTNLQSLHVINAASFASSKGYCSVCECVQINTIFLILRYWALQEIYPGNKTRHFRCIYRDSGIPFEDMLFFDNEMRNCREVRKLGVTSVYTPDGMTDRVWRDGLAQFAQSAPCAGSKTKLGSS